ncbi:hypothetical protein F5B20DRAFT_586140 [Whalleya microplaca]|nr:hypothetical protein F5B20DRAFT_586140 [Whalleya microplaca]
MSFAKRLNVPGLDKDILRRINGELASNLRDIGVREKESRQFVEDLVRAMAKYQDLVGHDKDGFYNAVEGLVPSFKPATRGDLLALVDIVIQSRRIDNMVMAKNNQADKTVIDKKDTDQTKIAKGPHRKVAEKVYSLVSAVQALLDLVDGDLTQISRGGPEIKTTAMALFLAENAQIGPSRATRRQPKKPEGWVSYDDIIPIDNTKKPAPPVQPPTYIPLKSDGSLAHILKVKGKGEDDDAIKDLTKAFKKIDFDPEMTDLTKCLRGVTIGGVENQRVRKVRKVRKRLGMRYIRPTAMFFQHLSPAEARWRALHPECVRARHIERAAQQDESRERRRKERQAKEREQLRGVYDYDSESGL